MPLFCAYSLLYPFTPLFIPFVNFCNNFIKNPKVFRKTAVIHAKGKSIRSQKMSIDVNLLKFLSTFKGDSIAEKLQNMEALEGNGDGTLLKQEFMDAVHENAQLIDINDWNGECTSQRDLIDKWWASLDTIQSSKKIEGTNGKFNEVNALSKTEIDQFTAKAGEIDWAAITAETRTDVNKSSIDDVKDKFTVDLKPLLEAKEHYTREVVKNLFASSYELAQLSTEDADRFNTAVMSAIENNYKSCLGADKSIDYDRLDVAILNDVTDSYFNNDQAMLDKMHREDISDLYNTRIEKIDSFDDPNYAGDVRAAASDCLTQIYDQYDSAYLDNIFDQVFGTHVIEEIEAKVKNDKIDDVRTEMDGLLDGLMNDENLAVKPHVDYQISVFPPANKQLYTGGEWSFVPEYSIVRTLGGRPKKQNIPAKDIKVEFVGDDLGAKWSRTDNTIKITAGDTTGDVKVKVTIVAPNGTTSSYEVTVTVKAKPVETVPPESGSDNVGDENNIGDGGDIAGLSDEEKRAAIISRFGELESSMWGNHSEIENGRVIRGDKYSDDSSHIWDNNFKSMYDRHDGIRLYYSCNESGGNWDKVCGELRVRLKEIVNYVATMMSGMLAEYGVANLTEYQIDQIVDKFMNNHKSTKCNSTGQLSDVSTNEMNSEAMIGLKTNTNCVYEAYETVGKASHMYVVDFADIVDAILDKAFAVQNDDEKEENSDDQTDDDISTAQVVGAFLNPIAGVDTIIDAINGGDTDYEWYENLYNPLAVIDTVSDAVTGAVEWVGSLFKGW